MKFSRSVLVVVICAFIAGTGLLIKKRYWYSIINDQVTSGPVVALGDSLTYGTGAARGEDWPTLVSQMCNCHVINEGTPGETTSEATQRLDKAVLSRHPGLVIVGLGGNDILRQLPRETMFDNLRQIIKSIQDSGAMVVLLGLNGFPLGGDLASGYKNLARETGSVYVPDIMGGIISNPKMKSDQVHPNAAGYKLIAARIYNKLEPYLEPQHP